MTELGIVAAIGWEVLDRFRVAGDFAISPHGIGIAVGYLAGAYVFTYEAPKRGYPEEAASSIVFWALIGTVIGARLGYVFTHASEFRSIGDVLAIYRGGISQLGGVVGAVAVSYVVVRRRKLPFLKGLDAAAIPIPLGVVIGRVGDLIIGDHLGRPTSWLLAFRYRGGNLAGYACAEGVCTTALSGDRFQEITAEGAVLRAGTPFGPVIEQGIGVHQTALYDFFIAMGLVLFLVFLNRRPRRPGVLFLTYMAWYGSGRIVTDLLRVENRFFGLTGSQWTSLVAVTVALAILLWFALRPLREDAPPGALEPEPAGTADPPAPLP